MNNNKHSIAPILEHSDYAEFYELRKNASTMTTSTIQWLHNHVKILLNEMRYQAKDNTLSVLSVGSGEGDIDIEIIKSISPELNPQWRNLKYDALEPNFTHKKRFEKRLSESSFADNVKVSVHERYFGTADDFENNESYDLILLIQVLYYFENPSETIQHALIQLKPTGRLIIINQSAAGIPEIQRKHMLSLKGDENEIFTTHDIKTILDQKIEFLYSLHDVNAHLDVTECLSQSEIGLKILSFCLECDLRKIHQEKLNTLLESLKKHSEIKEKGAILYEPIGIFIVNKNTITSNVIKIEQDNDPVDDYRQLAQSFDWGKIFLSINSANDSKFSNIQLLDVACGTGRWIQAFFHYLEPQVSQSNEKEIIYDLLDYSENCLLQAAEKIHRPLKLGEQHVSSIQNINLKNNFYDIIWSMHGFYTISKHDLSLVIEKLFASLNKNGTAFIAQATHRSFYVSFYDKFLDVYHSGEGKRFISAEDITKALEILEIEYQINVITYHEKIDCDNLDAIEHYIMNEATVNSFSKDDFSDKASAPRNTVLEDLFNHKEMKTYLESFIKNSSYYFPEEIWLISFKKKHSLSH